MLIPFMFYVYCLFFFNNPATTAIYTLSLHDALPIFDELPLIHRVEPIVQLAFRGHEHRLSRAVGIEDVGSEGLLDDRAVDRKSTRLNSSHVRISYAVFCLKKKNKKNNHNKNYKKSNQ